jgi:hypothetical protein
MQCDGNQLSMGAEENAGLYIDGDLMHGVSKYCRTFDNEVLSS